jgi:hypothetical protein
MGHDAWSKKILWIFYIQLTKLLNNPIIWIWEVAERMLKTVLI